MVTKTARTRQPTREMQRRCRRKRRAKMVRRLLYAAAVLLVAGAVAIVLYGGSPLHASAESVRFGRLVTAAFRDQLGLNLRGWDGVRYLYFDANNARVVAESSDTTVRSDPTFTVLEDCGCPAVLVEEGFITNASDRAALCTDSACEQAAELYYQCIIDFFE